MIDWVSCDEKLPDDEHERYYLVWIPAWEVEDIPHAEVRWYRRTTRKFEASFRGEDGAPVSHWAVVGAPKE